jgi:metal-responsive CopG/Arc/MetJ family transcriptional regulator
MRNKRKAVDIDEGRVSFLIRIPKSLAEEIDRLAVKGYRSRNGQATLMIEEWLSVNGERSESAAA